MKPIAEQTIVITGASSGIGRETAVTAGRRGARVVLAARNEQALAEAADEVRAAGGEAEPVVADVSRFEDVERIADRAVARFGGFDTWVNNAAVSEFARVRDMESAELERIVAVNLLGQMYGARAALPHLEARGGGVIVFVSSALGRQAVPLQSAYCASKFGVVGFAESLRMELQHDGTNVQVSTVLPPSVNTPLFDHARSRLGVKGKPVPPVYDPSVVAEAILGAAEHPRREVAVGMAARQLALLGRLPRPLAERVLGMDAVGFAQQQRDEPDDGRDNLFEPSFAAKARGPFGEFVISHDPIRRVADGVAAVGGKVGETVGGLVGRR